MNEEGIKFIPRWTPPVKFMSEHSVSHVGRLLSSPVKIPDSKEGLITKDIGACNNASDLTAGTPDGAWFVVIDFSFLLFSASSWGVCGGGGR